MALVVVTACTNRKTVAPAQRLQAQELPSGSQDFVAKLWRDRLSQADFRVPARGLYAGHGFAQALEAARLGHADLWIVSAGLGLVHGDDRVPGYDLTLSAGSESSIRRRITDGPLDAALWWSDLARRTRPKRSLAHLIQNRPEDLFVIGVPGSYLEMIQADLLDLSTADLARTRLIGPLHTADLPARLGASVMPYDDRFNGPDSPNPGTRADFPQRAMRHFVEHILPGAEHADASEHASLVGAHLAAWAWPEKIERRRLGDDQIVEVMLAHWDQADGQSAKLLRVLRDDEGIACEQGRFVGLHKRAKRTRFERRMPDTTLRLRAVRSHQGNGIELYSFFIPGAWIGRIADITRIHRDREERLAGFQREEIRRHVDSIVDYLDQGEVLFPNAIILAFAPEVAFVQARGGKPDGALDAGDAGTLSIPVRPEGNRVAWIVDGQQRSLALSRSANGDLNVPVIAFVAPDLETRREQFILVNKAKPLPRRLIDELLPEVETRLPRDLDERKIPSALCNQLARDPQSPFHGLIKQLSDKETKSAIVVDSAVVDMIRDSLKNPNGALAPFRSLGKEPSDIDGMYATLTGFWSSVRAIFPHAWGLPPEASRLMHSAGLRAMGALMDRIVTRATAHPDAESHIHDSLAALAPHCRWTEGVWEDLGVTWNEIQQTGRHVRQLSQLLCRLDYEATLGRGAS